MRRKNHGYSENTTQFLQRWLIPPQPWQKHRYFSRKKIISCGQCWRREVLGGICMLKRWWLGRNLAGFSRHGQEYEAEMEIRVVVNSRMGQREPETKAGVNSGGRRTWFSNGLLFLKPTLAHSWGAWVSPVLGVTSANPTQNIICDFFTSLLGGFATENRMKLKMKSCEGSKATQSAGLILTLIKAWKGLLTLQKSWDGLGGKGS